MINQKIQTFVRREITSKSSAIHEGDHSMSFFENTQVKEVARLLSQDGEALLVIQPDKNLNKQAKCMLINESSLDDSALKFLRSYIPGENSVESLVKRMDQEHENLMSEIDIKMSEIAEEKAKILQEYEFITRKEGVVQES